jgi:hypothetical protein
MNTHRTRLAVITGTALALVLGGASIVGAQTPGMAFGGDPGFGAMHGRGFGGGMGDGGFGGRGFGDRGDRGARILERVDGLVRQELTTVDDDGAVTVQRVEHGTVSAVAEGSISITLPTGEAVTIVTDDDTDAYGWDTDDRPMREEIELTAIVAGDDVMVWSLSEDGAGFVAERVAVLPAETDDDTDATDDSATPEASPATVG